DVAEEPEQEPVGEVPERLRPATLGIHESSQCAGKHESDLLVVRAYAASPRPDRERTARKCFVDAWIWALATASWNPCPLLACTATTPRPASTNEAGEYANNTH